MLYASNTARILSMRTIPSKPAPPPAHCSSRPPPIQLASPSALLHLSHTFKLNYAGQTVGRPFTNLQTRLYVCNAFLLVWNVKP